MDVVISDGGSTDGTIEAIHEFQRQYAQLHVRLIDNPVQTIPAGLNRAIAVATGTTIIRLDAHSMPATNYVELCLEALLSTKAANVGGLWEIRPSGSGWLSRAIAAAGASSMGAGDARYRVGGQAGPVETVPFGAYPAEWAKKGRSVR